MSNVLDQIIIREMLSAPVTVNTDYSSEIIDVSGVEAESSIQLVYNNGNNVNMNITLQVSNDKVNFSDVTESDQLIEDDEGSHIIEIGGIGVTYIRVHIAVTSGSIDLQSTIFKGSRRH
jgi:hypothetical protein